MLKHKTIQAFVAVWCAVCLSYAGIRTAWGALLDQPIAEKTETDTNTENTENVTEETTTPDSVVLRPNTPASENSKKDESEEAIVLGEEETEEPAKDKETSETKEAEMSEDQATKAEDTSETHESADEEAWDRFEETEDATQIAETLDIPSLNEYLSWFTCGSCRRNCSLDHPRCHNGSRLADLKAQEYYDAYGQ